MGVEFPDFRVIQHDYRGVLLVAKTGSLDSVLDFSINPYLPIIFIHFGKVNVGWIANALTPIPNVEHCPINIGINTAFLIGYVNYAYATESIGCFGERVIFGYRKVYHF